MSVATVKPLSETMTKEQMDKLISELIQEIEMLRNEKSI